MLPDPLEIFGIASMNSRFTSPTTVVPFDSNPKLIPTPLDNALSSPISEPVNPYERNDKRHRISFLNDQDWHDGKEKEELEVIPKTNASKVGRKGERSHKCTFEDCNKTFKRSEHLKRHQRTHTGERPFSCPLCHKYFSRADNLAQHIKIHSKVKRPNQDITRLLHHQSHPFSSFPPASSLPCLPQLCQLPPPSHLHLSDRLREFKSLDNCPTPTIHQARPHHQLCASVSGEYILSPALEDVPKMPDMYLVSSTATNSQVLTPNFVSIHQTLSHPYIQYSPNRSQNRNLIQRQEHQPQRQIKFSPSSLHQTPSFRQRNSSISVFQHSNSSLIHHARHQLIQPIHMNMTQ